MGKQKTPLSRQLADIDLKLLRIFKTVVDCGGFSAAETELNIATSTISNHMSDLEGRLDMRLCNRGRGGFSVTEHGKVVYQATEELLGALEQFRSRVNAAHDTLLGDLHIAFAEQTLLTEGNALVKVIALFGEEAPGVRLHLASLTADDIPQAVASGQTQMGISLCAHPPANLRCDPLFEERMALYCGRAHALFGCEENAANLQHLNQCEFVESPIMRSDQQVNPVIDRWNRQASALQQEARLALLLSGRYVGYLPQQIAALPMWRDQLYQLFAERFSYSNTYQLITRRQSQNNPIVERFRTLLLQSSRAPEAAARG
ncbi:LysR family transcriptional regulator [Pseudomaricurvus alkylphenolicus]|jgi:DNA-binding transcriptional LysR family regulator|uniref:LysR family transcriptional regulator n=1 Tax=Pseudomaricurvus alkylphenolicus TaxID=1306991 RepID=UPI0014232F86|nr:LysR family transcriptional regulator [Pseudomaricurvus alkylphenolicus]NIB41076.1 LysR family transcriptional regulator [Pseudomaricurvus alkylphenolicus]